MPDDEILLGQTEYHEGWSAANLEKTSGGYRLLGDYNTVVCDVKRVVPGKLVYVASTNAPDRVYSFKLNSVVIRADDGSFQPYRGEPLQYLGLHEGKKITLCKSKQKGTPDFLMAEPKSELRGGLKGHSITGLANRAAGYFQKR